MQGLVAHSNESSLNSRGGVWFRVEFMQGPAFNINITKEKVIKLLTVFTLNEVFTQVKYFEEAKWQLGI